MGAHSGVACRGTALQTVKVAGSIPDVFTENFH
jgi:hypothetical protein